MFIIAYECSDKIRDAKTYELNSSRNGQDCNRDIIDRNAWQFVFCFLVPCTRVAGKARNP